MAMPMIVKPLAAYFCWISISSGISPRHGAHHVAHKLSRTTLPLYWDRERSLPSRSLRVISGTGLPAALGLLAELPAATLTTPLRGWRVARSARYVAARTATTAIIVSRDFFNAKSSRFVPYVLSRRLASRAKAGVILLRSAISPAKE